MISVETSRAVALSLPAALPAPAQLCPDARGLTGTVWQGCQPL